MASSATFWSASMFGHRITARRAARRVRMPCRRRDRLRPSGHRKSYPTPAQEPDLIRYPGLPSHVVQVGVERVAILVCHDLAALESPRQRGRPGHSGECLAGDAKRGRRGNPDASHPATHTVDKARTWTAAWARFAGKLSGRSLRATTTVIRHLDHGYSPLPGPVDASLLAGTGWGDRVVDVVVGGVDDPVDAAAATSRPPRRDARPADRLPPRSATARSVLNGVGLAQVALDVFRARSGSYPDGIRINELHSELESAGHIVDGNDPLWSAQRAQWVAEVG